MQQDEGRGGPEAGGSFPGGDGSWLLPGFGKSFSNFLIMQQTENFVVISLQQLARTAGRQDSTAGTSTSAAAAGRLTN